MDRQLRNLDAGIIELLEHSAQRGDIAVVGHAQDQVVLLARAGRERALGRVQGIRVGELQPDMAARDASLELARRALGDDPATVKDRDPVGELVGLVQVLGGEEDRDALGRQPADGIPHGAPTARIQAGRGLVEEDHPRGADQRHRQVKPPPHPARVGGNRPAGGVRQVEPAEQLGHSASSRGATQMVQIGHQTKVLLAGGHVVQGRELAGNANRCPHPVRVGDHVVTGD